MSNETAPTRDHFRLYDDPGRVDMRGARSGDFASEGESFNPQALSEAIGDQFTVQSELADIISGDFEPKIEKGAAEFETALIKLASQTRRFITQDLRTERS